MTEIYLVQKDVEGRTRLYLTTQSTTSVHGFSVIAVLEVKELASGYDLESMIAQFPSCFYKKRGGYKVVPTAPEMKQAEVS